ncbi:Ubiquinone biosynthesis O-methyltransferase, mitochondrial [Vibrio stylophorae]|uniref:Ubiquinone biosynthesis O-methyltransferase, mitochondrial n=1 Tax=Vibrio stylophorae TaxID=659351 RepID=A0ABM8ZUK0_9VIBR|nr:class I SAM-dependent methyltransferase [Vibrio stylophorae]CAH0533985.1 Ubiquinone biosynthesis O-methyltransferase, mitochondrial [Vibrio stylophorae]
MSEMYQTHAKAYAKAVQDNIYNAHLERPSTLALMDDVHQCDVLDMGCGSGIYAQTFLAKGARSITCIDASTQMIELVKQSFGEQVTAYVQDLSLGLPQEQNDSKDVLICPLVLHYIADLKPLFAEVARVLKPGGYLVFSTHHPFADFECSSSGNYFSQEPVEEMWDTVGTPVAVRFYRRPLTVITEAISAAGLVITKLSEGEVDEVVKSMCEETYWRLKHNPNFLFVRCEKPVL